MIGHYIKTVKNQIDYIDHVIKENPNKSKTQAKFWQLRYEFEQLLEYLAEQAKKEAFPTKENSILAPLKANDFLLDNSKKTGFHQKTLEIEDKILEIIKGFPKGIHISQIKEILPLAIDTPINDSKLTNRLHNMCKKRGIIENPQKGIYIAKHS